MKKKKDPMQPTKINTRIFFKNKKYINFERY